MFKYITFLFSSPVLLLALNAPTNLQVRALSKHSVSLDWVDNADDEIGFKIFRNGHLLTLAPANTTHFEDTNLQPNTTYTYLVYATDHVGDELITSKPIYKVGEPITVNFRYLNDDIAWIGVYPIDTPDEDYERENLHHHQSGDKIGSDTWVGRNTAGMYEVRAFGANDVKRASYAFKVEAAPKSKKLIFAGGTNWKPTMASNLISRYDEIMKLPFDGYTVLGNHFTDKVMSGDVLTVNYIMDTKDTKEDKYRLRDLANFYREKDMFLLVRIKFPGDFWKAEDIWNNIISNFGVLAKVAKDLHFKGIALDDEGYKAVKKMINFKFPTKAEVEANPNNYAQWEKDGAEEDPKTDANAYRNPNHTFEEHIEKVISLYQAIMEAMVAKYPDIDLLVYHGPMLGHAGTYKYNYKGHKVFDSNKRFYEFTGAIFTGLKRGLGVSGAEIHDMGEMYKYRTDEQFARSSQWRKYDMAKDVHNDTLDPSYQWRIPMVDRASWREKVHVGHMVFNLEVKDSYPEFNTSHTSHISDIKTDISLALSFADEYAIYYCEHQEWLMPDNMSKYKDEQGNDVTVLPISQVWKDMVREAILRP